MTNEQILKKAIEKAVKGGFVNGKVWLLHNCELMPKIRYDEHFKIIFSHDFAKAFWGEQWVSANGVEIDQFTPEPILRHWQYHLQQMVLREEPLKYLERFLEKEKNNAT